MSKYFLACFFIFITCFSFTPVVSAAEPQQNQIDSLLTLLKTDKQDTNKVNHLADLCFEYNKIGDYDDGLQSGNSALQLAKELNFPQGTAKAYNNIGIIYYSQGNYDKALENYFASLKLVPSGSEGTPQLAKIAANAYNNIGTIYKNQGNYDKALENYFASLKIKEEIGDKKGIAGSYNNIGIIYADQGNYEKALENYFTALKINEEIGNKNWIASNYNNIGLIYADQGNYDKALENYFASLKIYEEIGDKNGIAASYINIGNIYAYQGKTHPSPAQREGLYNKALENYFASLKIKEVLGDKNGIAMSYNNIGIIYKDQGNLSRQRGDNLQAGRDYDKALKNYFASLKISEETGDKNGMANSYINIGEINTELKKYSEAENWLNKGLHFSKEIGTKEWTKNAYEGLSRLDSILGNWKDAYEYHKLYSEIKDSIFNEESSKQIAEMSAKYETEKKEAQIKLMEKDKEKQAALALAESRKQQIIIWSVAGGLVLVAVVLLVVFRSLRVTRKQKHIIEIQKDEVTRQRDIVEEQKAVVEKQKAEIAHKNKDLTDSINYAQRIQAAILTSEQYLNDIFLPLGQVSSHFILYKPKDIVAGDFYWAYKTPDEKAIWVAADCTGHGVPGAFMSMIGNSLLNEIVVEKGIHEPDEILNKMRTGVIKALGQSGGDIKKDGMDAALCCWDKANSKISFSGANNSLWIIRNSEFIELEPDIQPIGHYTETIKPFTKREFQLQQGDALYTFTDGYCDQFGGPKGKKFKYKPFRELLISIQNKSMPEQKQILNKTIDEWRGELEQIDDICIIGVRI